MRDLLIIAIVMTAAFLALRRPWIGVLSWVWLSLMNPHRFAFGAAYDAPLAAIAAVSTLLGLAFTTNRQSPFKGPSAVWLALFMVWMTMSWRMGFAPDDDYEQWKKVIKIIFMVFVALTLVNSRQQILTLAMVVALSLGLLGLKGGVFTVITGGNYRVWGPPGTFIEDNNEFALALIMTVPLLQFVRLQCKARWASIALGLMMLMCAASAVGSYSRGGFLALIAMGAIYWWRGTNKIRNGALIAVIAVVALAFMPEQWAARMSTIDDYQQDTSSLGRLSAWWTAYGIAKNYVFGAGFEIARAELVAIYSPYPTFVHAAHSIYFLVLGNHGFIGLFMFLAMFGTTWSTATWIRRTTKGKAGQEWCFQLASMCQVSLAAYFVGGAFLSLSYFDLPYYVMTLLLCTATWLRSGRMDEDVDVVPRLRPLAWLLKSTGLVRA